MANRRRGETILEVRGKEIKFSLPMSNLEKVEARLNLGVLKILANAESNDLTLTQCVTILEIASNGQLKRREIHRWADRDGVVNIIKGVVALLSATFKTGNAAEEIGDEEKKS